MTFLSWFSKMIQDSAYLASSEKLAMWVIACGAKLFAELVIAINPAHQVASGGARVAVGEKAER